MKKNTFNTNFARSFDKRYIRLKKKFKKTGWLAHHGIERSGSNYLRACLVDLGVDLVNKFDLNEGVPGHKHYRWYKDKKSIPLFRFQFRNSTIVDNVEELNSCSNFNPGTSHIVIQKDCYKAISSIANFFLRKGLFISVEEAQDNITAIQCDYKNYYDFWNELSVNHPEQVQVISYEELSNNALVLKTALDILKINYAKSFPEKFIFTEVEESPAKRKEVFSEQSIKDLLLGK